MRNLYLLWIVVVAVFWSLSAQAAENDILRVDFANLTYHPGESCVKLLHKSTVKVRNGSFGSCSDMSMGFEVATDKIVYGDLTGDGRDEAIVRTYCGGMHPIEQAFIYTMRDGHPTLLAKLEEGDRAFGGITDSNECQGCKDGLRIENGLLIVERARGKAACCPDYIEIRTYRWNGKQFVQAGPGKRRVFVEKQQ